MKLRLLLLASLSILTQKAWAVTYNTTSSGSWSSAGWSPSQPSSLAAGDIININHTINGGNASISLPGSGVTINLFASFTVAQLNFQNGSGGTVAINTNGNLFKMNGAFSTNSNPTINVNGAITAGSMSINGGADLTVSGVATVNGALSTDNSNTQLSFQSSLTVTGAATLNNGSDMTVAGAASISGNLSSNNSNTALISWWQYQRLKRGRPECNRQYVGDGNYQWRQY